MRAARLIICAFFFAGIGALGAAQAETFVLVYSEGSVVTLPGGATVTKGEQVDGDKLVQLGPADNAIFVSQAGNVARRAGPYCGTIAGMNETAGGGGVFGMFGGKTQASAPEGCPK